MNGNQSIKKCTKRHIISQCFCTVRFKCNWAFGSMFFEHSFSVLHFLHRWSCKLGQQTGLIQRWSPDSITLRSLALAQSLEGASSVAMVIFLPLCLILSLGNYSSFWFYTLSCVPCFKKVPFFFFLIFYLISFSVTPGCFSRRFLHTCRLVCETVVPIHWGSHSPARLQSWMSAVSWVSRQWSRCPRSRTPAKSHMEEPWGLYRLLSDPEEERRETCSFPEY